MRLKQPDDLLRPCNLGFPDLADLKRLVRDRVAPDRDLGHSDRSRHERGDT